MAEIEHLVVTLPADVAAVVQDAVRSGAYASAGEVVRAALHDWTTRSRGLDSEQSLRADIEQGLADIAAGRVHAFDLDDIIANGRGMSNDRRPAKRTDRNSPMSPV
ncbi:ribbon-helix-helix domain-containing protein [Methylobacterium sp. JK268]